MARGKVRFRDKIQERLGWGTEGLFKPFLVILLKKKNKRAKL